VNPLVPALNAQFGAGAGGKRGFRACTIRAAPNGMGTPTLFVRRPVSVRRRGLRPAYGAGLNPCRGAMRGGDAVSAVRGVACLEWSMRIGDHKPCANGHGAGGDCPLKYSLQKRLRDGKTAVENT
jgi:hypothetical protein